MKDLIKKALRTVGYDLQKRNQTRPVQDNSMLAGLERISQRHTQLNTIVDVGAAAGTWTEKALHFWPDAHYLLVEPLEERQDSLQALAHQHSRVKVAPVVLGEKADTVTFSVSQDLDGSGMYSEEDTHNTNRRVTVASLDELLAQHQLSGPYLIKLDTHGYELPIFRGAQQALKHTAVIIVEAYGFYVSPHAVLFYELCTYLDGLGFRPINVLDVFNRKKDGAFWQCDIVFAPKSFSAFNDNAYV